MSFFSDVDGSATTEAAGDYLRSAASNAAVQRLRRAGYEQMGIVVGSAVLDVGCGVGEVCAEIVDLVGASGRVVGVDISDGLIAGAREQWAELPVEFEVGDAEHLHFADGSFDVVRSERVLQHLDAPATAIAEMARVVRPGGCVFVLDSVHDASLVATEHPEVWATIRAHGLGAVRQPRVGLSLKGWMQDAGLEVTVTGVAGVLDEWPLARHLMQIDAGIEAAVAAGALGAADAAAFREEQQRRFEHGAYAQLGVAIQAVGTKPRT